MRCHHREFAGPCAHITRLYSVRRDSAIADGPLAPSDDLWRGRPFVDLGVFDADAGPLALFADRGMRRFWLRALLAPGVAMSWRQQALTLYRQHGAPIPNARVLSKPLHGYLRRRLNPASRLSALVEHYHHFNSLMSPDCLRAFCAGEPLELARLSGRKGSRFRLYLVNATAVQTQREGECTICLEREGSATILSRLTFNLFTIDGRVAVAIGGLQGPRSGHKREVIDATRALFG